MPQFDDATMEAMVGDGSVFAIALDTSIFDRFSCDLEHPRLAALDQLSESKLQLLVPEIVAREVQRHITRNAAESLAGLRKALAAYRRRWPQVDLDVDARLDLDPGDEALRQFEAFMQRTGARQVPLSEPPDLAQRAAELYFSGEPPFEIRETKKHEFPDALALLSLEALAGRRGRTIMCVSADRGWTAFCAQSKRLVCVDDLDTALSYLNSSGRVRAEKIWNSLRERGKRSWHYDALHTAFRQRFKALDFIPEVHSGLDYVAKPILEDLDKIDLARATHPLVIEADPDTVTFTFKVKAEVVFAADFAFYIARSPGEEDVEVGAVRSEVVKTIEYEVLMNVERDSEAQHPIRTVMVDRQTLKVPFGAIDPFNRL
jgi:predicted nucleic acid-binding protein